MPKLEAKAEEVLDDLRAEYARRIRRVCVDLPAHQALQLADALCHIQQQRLAGLRVIYRAKPPIDGEAITEDWRRGLSLTEITRKHQISRTVAYEHHPMRVPKAVVGEG